MTTLEHTQTKFWGTRYLTLTAATLLPLFGYLTSVIFEKSAAWSDTVPRKKEGLAQALVPTVQTTWLVLLCVKPQTCMVSIACVVWDMFLWKCHSFSWNECWPGCRLITAAKENFTGSGHWLSTGLLRAGRVMINYIASLLQLIKHCYSHYLLPANALIYCINST